MFGDFNADIQHLSQIEVPQLVQQLPYDSWYKDSFEVSENGWIFKFECNSVNQKFSALAHAQTPFEAFEKGRHLIICQIKEWHRTRFDQTAPGVAPAKSVPLSAAEPQVLIVEDDLDLALAMRAAMHKLGCRVELATCHEELHRKLLNSRADLVLLDWQLNGRVTADQVVERATRLIEAFSDLRERFVHHPLKVITHSVLSKGDVALPASSRRFFSHSDHWQKPLTFDDLVARAAGLLGTPQPQEAL